MKGLKQHYRIFSILLIFIINSPLFSMASNQVVDAYDKQWKKVEEFQRKQLPQSALNLVDDIYNKAKSEQNEAHWIKALVFRFNLNKQIDVDRIKEQFNLIEKDIFELSTVSQSVLHCLVAEMYWWHFSSNRYKVMQRAIGSGGNDMDTWDLNSYSEKIQLHYNRSLVNDSLLKQSKIQAYNVLLDGELNYLNHRPTVYDFIITRQIDFYRNNAESFNTNSFEPSFYQLEFWSEIPVFINSKISNEQIIHPKGRALELYQERLSFRVKQVGENEALFYANLQRLQYVYSISDNVEKEVKYFEALTQMQSEVKGNKWKNALKLEKAQLLWEMSQRFENHSLLGKDTLRTKVYSYCREVLNHKTLPENQKKHAKYLLDELMQKHLKIEAEQVCLPNMPVLAKMAYRNLTSLKVKVYRVPALEFVSSRGNYSSESPYERLVRRASLMESYDLELPEYNDYFTHSAAVMLKKLPLGRYVLVFEELENGLQEEPVKSYLEFKVSNLSAVTRLTHLGNQEMWIVHRETGQPIGGVEVKEYFPPQSYRTVMHSYFGKQLMSDKNGMLTVKQNGKYEDFYCYLVNMQDTLVLNDRFYTNGIKEAKPITKVYFYTDRAVYRPGQPIYFKALTTMGKSDSIPMVLPGQDVLVELKDVNYKPISKKNFITNKFGSFTGSFILPKGIMPGNYRLNTKYGSTTILVEEYKRPSFEVKLDTPSVSLKIGDKVQFSGSAVRYNGLPVNNAKVKYTVSRTPFWRWYGFGSSTEKIVTTGEVQSDKDGKFQIDFIAYGTKSDWIKQWNYNVNVQVVSQLGESQEGNFMLPLTNDAVKLNINAPSKIALNDLGRVEISVENVLGEPLDKGVELTVYKLKHYFRPIQKLYWTSPDTVLYTDEMLNEIFTMYRPVFSGFEKQLDIEGELKRSVLQVNGNLALANELSVIKEPGIYKLVATVSNEDGQKLIKDHFLEVYSENGKNNVPSVCSLIVKDEQSTKELGSTLELEFLGSEKQIILCELLQNNKMLQRKQISFKGKRQKQSISISELLKGGFDYRITYVWGNRIYSYSKHFNVPFKEKDLQLELSTFRNMLTPGSKEEWKLAVKNTQGTPFKGELLACMYDASLDSYRVNQWNSSFMPVYHASRQWENKGFYSSHSYTVNLQNIGWFNPKKPVYPDFIGGFSGLYKRYSEVALMGQMAGVQMESKSAPMRLAIVAEEEEEDVFGHMPEQGLEGVEERDKVPASKMKVRSNFQETAFFYPYLVQDAQGDYMVNFTLPESLTRWKFKAFAHGEGLEAGYFEKSFEVQKELMVEINPPRFLTMGDTVQFPILIRNTSGQEQTVKVNIECIEPVLKKDVKVKLGQHAKSITLSAGESITVTCSLIVPDNIAYLQFTAKVKGNQHSDGEQRLIPILSNKKLITKTYPLWMEGTESKTIKTSSSTGEELIKMGYEITANPIWYAVRALPGLNNSESAGSEQLFNSLYANCLSGYLVDNYPEIKKAFYYWSTSSQESLASNLEKNQEWKALKLEQTPWYNQAKNESIAMQQLVTLFDENNRLQNFNVALNGLKENQLPNGAWPWYKGMRPNRYITEHILLGFVRLSQRGVLDITSSDYRSMLTKAMNYLLKELEDDYKEALKLEQKYEKVGLTLSQIQTLLMYTNLKENGYRFTNAKGVDYFARKIEQEWRSQALHYWPLIGMYAVEKEEQWAKEVLESLKEHALNHAEMGTYWQHNYSGYGWGESGIAFQSMAIEFFEKMNEVEMAGNMKKWLLKQKQTTQWKGDKATVEAVFALLGKEQVNLNESIGYSIDAGVLSISAKDFEQKAEFGTGYIKQSIQCKEVEAPEELTFNRTGKGISWGGVFTQSLVPVQEISAHGGDLKVQKRLFRKIQVDGKIKLVPLDSSTKLEVGDIVLVDLQVSTNRNLDFVLLSDKRAGAFEPIDKQSCAVWLSGSSAYKAITDTEMRFYFNRLQKGSYNVQYELYVTNAGTFSGGHAEVQCYYAPEFTANSKAEIIKVEK